MRREHRLAFWALAVVAVTRLLGAGQAGTRAAAAEDAVSPVITLADLGFM